MTIVYVTYLSSIKPEEMIGFLSLLFPNWEKDFPLSKKELAHTFMMNWKIIFTMFSSIIKCDKNALLLLIVDEGLDIPKELFLGLPVEFVFYKRKTNYLVYERMLAYRLVLKKKIRQYYLFLDWDLLFQKDISRVFEKKFDFFFTARDATKMYKNMPINVGVFGANLENYFIVWAFFNRWILMLEKMSENHKLWLGEQLALYELLKKGSPEGGKFLILNEDYNYPVPYNNNFYGGYIEGPYILHFKGVTKKFLIPYWEKYLKNI